MQNINHQNYNLINKLFVYQFDLIFGEIWILKSIANVKKGEVVPPTDDKLVIPSLIYWFAVAIMNTHEKEEPFVTRNMKFSNIAILAAKQDAYKL